MDCQAQNLLRSVGILVYKRGVRLPILPRRADLTKCPRPLCGEPLSVSAPSRDHPPRWVCPSGHSGYLIEPDLKELERHHAFPPGETHSSRSPRRRA